MGWGAVGEVRVLVPFSDGWTEAGKESDLPKVAQPTDRQADVK